MRQPKPVRFGRLEEDEGTRQRKRYEENLKQKKDQLKQEFEQMEEIRRFDELSVASLNDFQFKRELDKLSSLRKQRQFKLQNMNKHLNEIIKRNECDEEGLRGSQQIQLNTGFKSQITNHQSDSLYQKFQKNLLAKNPNEYSDYICELKQELIRYQQLIESEIEHTKQLDSVQQELIKGNINIQKDIHEIKQMNQVSEGRFSNIETLKFLSNEKNLTSKKNLKIIKQELREMEDMRNKWRKIQQDKQNEYQKEINIGEEYVSHNGMKIEEANQKNIDLENEIIQLQDEEQQILNKRYKSLNLIKYIECFEKFEQIFMNKITQDKIVGNRLIDRYEENQELINLELNRGQEEQDQQQVNNNLDRNQLIHVINDFFCKHPGGAAQIINFMIEKYWQLSMDLQQNNITFENLIQERKQLNYQSEDLDNQINEYFNKNQYIKDEEQQQQEYQNTLVDGRGEVAFDTGLIISHQGEQRKTTTLNIQSIEMDEASENETLAAKILKLQNLLFNFMLSLSELLHRSAQILKIVRENSQNMSSSDLDQTVQQILQFVQQIWQKKQFKNEIKLKNKHTHKPHLGIHHNHHHHNTKENISSVEIENQEYEQQIGLYQIQHVFNEVLKSDLPDDAIQQGAKFFFIRSKQDQLIWNLLTPQHLNQFVKNIQKQLKQIKHQINHQSEQINIDQIMTAYEFSVLRQDLVQVFCENFKLMLQQYKIMENKLRDLSSELKVYLKDKDSKFDPKKLDQIQVREGTLIKEAREAISRKMDLYFTGEIKKTLSDYSINNNKLIKKNSMDQADFNEEEEQNEFQQQQLNGQQDIFVLDDYKNNNNEEQLEQIKQFFRSKLTQKYDPSIEIKRRQFDEQKKQQQAKQKLSDKDEFEQERDEIKDIMNEVWKHNQENITKAQSSPQVLEQFSEKKAVIREVTKRLYGDRGTTAKTLKSMSIATVIISDIDRLDKQPSAMEEPQLISNFKMQKKNVHRDLNNEISLPTLNFLKPNTVYYQRRQQSQDQLRAMAQKKYDLIENGLNIQQSRPNTEHISINHNLSKKNQKTLQPNSGFLQKRIPVNTKDQTDIIDKFYARYGDQKTSQQFLNQLMNQKQSNTDSQQLFNGVTLQEFPFSTNKKNPNNIYQSSSGGGRPKSILVQPIT